LKWENWKRREPEAVSFKDRSSSCLAWLASWRMDLTEWTAETSCAGLKTEIASWMTLLVSSKIPSLAMVGSSSFFSFFFLLLSFSFLHQRRKEQDGGNKKKEKEKKSPTATLSLVFCLLCFVFVCFPAFVLNHVVKEKEKEKKKEKEKEKKRKEKKKVKERRRERHYEILACNSFWLEGGWRASCSRPKDSWFLSFFLLSFFISLYFSLLLLRLPLSLPSLSLSLFTATLVLKISALFFFLNLFSLLLFIFVRVSLQN